MLGRSGILGAVAILVLIAVFVATLAASNRHHVMPVAPRDPATASAPDDLSAELRHCGRLGPQDAEDPQCRAVWEKNRERFFGRPARPANTPAAPASPASGGVES
jgi:conjugative transfer region protein TrbK